jgi:hypothetical protein
VTEPIQFLTDKNGQRLAAVIRMDVYAHMLQELEALKQSVKPIKPHFPKKQQSADEE